MTTKLTEYRCNHADKDNPDCKYCTKSDSHTVKRPPEYCKFVRKHVRDEPVRENQ